MNRPPLEATEPMKQGAGIAQAQIYTIKHNANFVDSTLPKLHTLQGIEAGTQGHTEPHRHITAISPRH